MRLLDDMSLVDPCLLHRRVGSEAIITSSFSAFITRGYIKKIPNKAKNRQRSETIFIVDRISMLMGRIIRGPSLCRLIMLEGPLDMHGDTCC